MIKGSTRQVIVVRGTDSKLFEQAVFFLREEGSGISEEALLDEAVRAADQYTHRPHRRKPIPRPLCFLLGALPIAVAWVVTLVFHF